MGTEPGWIHSFSPGRCLCCLNTDNVLVLYQYCSSDCTATTHKAQTHHHNSNSSSCTSVPARATLCSQYREWGQGAGGSRPWILSHKLGELLYLYSKCQAKPGLPHKQNQREALSPGEWERKEVLWRERILYPGAVKQEEDTIDVVLQLLLAEVSLGWPQLPPAMGSEQHGLRGKSEGKNLTLIHHPYK